MITKSKKIVRYIYKYVPVEEFIAVFCSNKRFKHVLTREEDAIYSLFGAPELKFKAFARCPTIPDTAVKLMNYKYQYNPFGDMIDV